MSFSHRAKLMSGVAFGALVWAAPADATILEHNGSQTSTPPGTGDVNVDLTCNDVSIGGSNCTKNFFEFGVDHVLVLETDGYGNGQLSETIVNDTGVPWTDFHFIIDPEFGAPLDTFSLIAETAPTNGPMRMGNDVWLIFETPVLDEESFSIDFEFSGDVRGNTNDTFQIQITQFPTFETPVPGTLGLAAAGLGGLAALRRRKRRKDED